ncbi:hypothetical protein TrispH2_000537 [Trichoplax sp. H2]|nr:hypothetical protein TrispH2_000537 [Trichoplax sp. H2]|eukprot:RDD47849.1 hypothetical protein TrispH2_000537 [Trichoplax sp. H2]
MKLVASGTKTGNFFAICIGGFLGGAVGYYFQSRIETKEKKQIIDALEQELAKLKERKRNRDADIT